MTKISIFGVLSNIQILLRSALAGKLAGTDGAGNRYYRGKPRAGDSFNGKPRERRWVIYREAPEASLVPPEWHGWLHHQTDAIPQDNNPYRQRWQKPHQANMTGTSNAYLPDGHALRGGDRAESTSDYQSWQPPK